MTTKTIDANELARLGLYDPDAADAAEQLTLLEYFLNRGATIEDIQRARADRLLSRFMPGLASDLALTPPGRYTGRELAEVVELPFDSLVIIYRTLGLPPPDPFNRAYSDDDVAMVRAFRAPEGLFPDESEYRSILRVIGSAMASVAEAGVTAYIRGVERPLELVGAPPIAHAQAQMEAIFTYGQFAQAMPPLLRRHTMMAIRRARVTRLNSVRPGTDTYAVGFIDLVGFTPLSQQIASEDLADLVTRFEALAIDIMSDHEGRVVKLIGDEVMFVAVDAAEACEIALTLIESFDRSEHDVSPRGGLAYGEVLTREGDFFGPTVNLASRIVDQAVAGDILVTQSVHDGVKDASYSFEGAGKRMLKGFDEPVRLWAVTRGTAFPA